MTVEKTQIVAVLREHFPRDRYDDDGSAIATFCTCGAWEGDYFADGEAGPFDEHLADALAMLYPPDSRCCPGAGTMAHVRGCVNHPESAR